MPVSCKDIRSIIEKTAPKYNAFSKDSAGLLTSDKEADITSVMRALNVDNNIIDEAIGKECMPISETREISIVFVEKNTDLFIRF